MGRSTSRNSHVIFFFCVLFLKGTLFLISSWKTGVSRAVCSSQDWGYETECMHGFPSMTFCFKVIYSVTILLLRIWIIFWPCDDCYSPSVTVFVDQDLGTGVDERKNAGDPSLEWNKGALFVKKHVYISSYKAALGSKKIEQKQSQPNNNLQRARKHPISWIRGA